MTEDRTTWMRTSRVIMARPEELYRAFIDPAELIAWLPPAQMTGHIYEFDVRIGGGYRMSLFYPPNERVYRGRRPTKRTWSRCDSWKWTLHARSSKPSVSSPPIRLSWA